MREHFCIGDFFVVDPASKVRFDEEMKLKEDYDFTCAQLKEYGLVCRFNRLLLHAEHYTNAGGAVDVRNRKEEKRNIKILRGKWPGVFLNSPRGDTEVRLYWDKRDRTLGGDRWYFPNPKQPGRALGPADAERMALQKGLHAKFGIEIPAWLSGEDASSCSSSSARATPRARKPQPRCSPSSKLGKRKKPSLAAMDGLNAVDIIEGKRERPQLAVVTQAKTTSPRRKPAAKKTRRSCISVGDDVYVARRGWGKKFTYTVEALPKRSGDLVLLKAVKYGEGDAEAPLSSLVLLP
jgi:hypothetical protein